MEFIGLSAAYNQLGGFGPHADVSALLAVQLGDYGAAIKSVDITAYLRSTHPTTGSLHQLRERFDHELDALPSITFRRSAHKVIVHFLSDRFVAEDSAVERPTNADRAVAAAEIEVALALVRRRVKPRDDFDVDRFEADVHEIVTAVGGVTDWSQIRSASRARSEAHAAANPWGALDLDWDTFHPDARSILDDPFFWDRDNELSPNGNDTGHDILAEVQQWMAEQESPPLLHRLTSLMHDWGITPIDWNAIDEAAVKALSANDPVAFHACNQAAVGLAFASIKLSGSCPADVARAGLAAIERNNLIANATRNPEERDADKKLRTKLGLFA